MSREVRREVPSLVTHSCQMFDSHLQDISFIDSCATLGQIGDEYLQFFQALVDPGSASLLHDRFRDLSSLKRGGG